MAGMERRVPIRMEIHPFHANFGKQLDAPFRFFHGGFPDGFESERKRQIERGVADYEKA
jgi:hypothetical protein